MYPMDLRASTIAHTGGDVYGTSAVAKFGDLSYTGYAGRDPSTSMAGIVYRSAPAGIKLNGLASKQIGGDLRWNNLIPGLLFGASYLHVPTSGATQPSKWRWGGVSVRDQRQRQYICLLRGVTKSAT